MSHSIQYVNDELLKEVCTKKVQVSANQFSRFQFALNNILDILLRYKSICQFNGIENDSEKIITFYFCDNKGRSRNSTEVFLLDADAAGNVIEETNAEILEDFIKSEDKPNISCFVIPGDIKEVLAIVGKRSTINLPLVENDEEFRDISINQNVDQKGKTFVIGTSNISKQVDIALEKWTFQSVKAVFEALTEDIEACKSKEQDRYVNFSKDGSENKLSLKRYLTCTLCETSKCKIQNLGVYKKDDSLHSLEKIETYPVGTSLTLDDVQPEVSHILCFNKQMLSTLKTETKVCLREEIIGLFNMSDVSIDGISMTSQHKSETDLETISKKLFEEFEGLHGIGYRMQKLQIVVKDCQQFDSEEKKNALSNALKELNIHEYEIVKMSCRKYLKPGDEIVVGQACGSFGCFAKSKDDTEGLLGLISKHVASTGQQKEMHTINDGDHKSVGRIIQETVEDGGLDIAAAKLSIPKHQCDTRLKSASGSPRKLNNQHIIQSEKLRGRKVHMWGAKSKPGKGIITVPEYRCKGMDHSLIQVEDIVDGEGTVDQRFAQPGDSGAVACTDDPCQEFVYPISMNMGCMNYNDVEKDNKQKVKKHRGKYLTVPLSSGLREIGKKIGKDIELC